MTDAGTVIAGIYRLDEVLGRGASATTWAATTIADGRRVAIKEIALPDVRAWKALDLFEREARVLAQLRHPRIPRWLATERTDTALYLVQELAPGRSLAARLSAGERFDEAAARRVAEQVLDALGHLQATSPPIVHRDVKPANLVQDDDGVLRLVDFGAVRDVQGGSVGSTVAGTYGYMAPEQLHGQSSPATDLYGLGATLVHLLTRTPPHELPQQRLRIDWRGRAQVGRPFADFVDRLLAPVPEDRFASAREALDALRGRRVPAPPSKAGRARLFALGGVLLALVAGGAVWVWRDLVADRADRALEAKAVRKVPMLPPRPAPARLHAIPFLDHHRVHDFAVFSLALSDDETTLAVGSHDHSLRTLAFPLLGETRKVFVGSTTPVGGVAFFGDRLVGGGDKVRVFSLGSGAVEQEIESGPRVTSLHPVGDGKRFVTASFDGKARLFSLGAKVPERSYDHLGGKLLDAVPSHDRQWLATVGDDATLRVWELESGKLRCTLPGHVGPVDHVAFSPDGTRIATTGDDGTLRTWDPVTCKAVATRWVSDDELWAITFTRDGKHIVVGSKDNRLAMVETIGGRLAADMQLGAYHGVLRLLVDKANTRLILGAGTGQVALFDLAAKPTAVPPARPVAPTPPAGETPIASLVRRAEEALDRWSGRSEVLTVASTLLDQADALDPKHAPAKVVRARLARLRGYVRGDEYTPEAIAASRKLLDEAERLDPKLPALALGRGWHALAEKDAARARALATALRAARPDDRRVLMFALTVAEDEHAWADVEKTALVLLDGGTPREIETAYAGLEAVYRARHEYARAAATYEALIAESPSNVWAKGNYAQFLLDRGELDRALLWIDKTLAQSDYGVARRIKVDILCRLADERLFSHHDGAAAARHYDEAEAADKVPHACVLYGRAALAWLTATQKGDPGGLDRAQKLLERTVALEPGHEAAKKALTMLPSLRKALGG